jgi:hypothetical protein
VRSAIRKCTVVCVAALTLVPLLASIAGATHFRYGNYSWTSTGPTTAEFSVANAYRRSANPCIDVTTSAVTTCSGSDALPLPGDVIQEDTGGTIFNFGDGTTVGGPSGPLLYEVTSVDVANDWLFGLALDPTSLPAKDTTISHTYPASGDYTASTSSCCRLSTLVNAPDGNYIVETIVNVGGTNRPPVSTLPPIVNCPVNGTCSFLVPGSDADGDTLAFRFSTAAESGILNPLGPIPATVSSTGAFSWDTTGAGAAGAQYAAQVTIEDLDATSAVKSKVAVDFIINLVDNVGATPQFVPPTPTCGSTVSGTAGAPLSFTVTASDADAGDTVTLTAAGLPPGATMTPGLPTGGNPVSSVFAWTPDDAGTNVVTYAATDPAGNQALCSLTLVVEEGGQPPAADPQSVSTPKNTAVPITLTGSDPDGDTLTFAVASDPAHGTLSGTAPGLTYTPAAGYTGPDSFTFTVNDGHTTSDPATVSITVTEKNKPPKCRFRGHHGHGKWWHVPKGHHWLKVHNHGWGNVRITVWVNGHRLSLGNMQHHRSGFYDLGKHFKNDGRDNVIIDARGSRADTNVSFRITRFAR